MWREVALVPEEEEVREGKSHVPSPVFLLRFCFLYPCFYLSLVVSFCSFWSWADGAHAHIDWQDHHLSFVFIISRYLSFLYWREFSRLALSDMFLYNVLLPTSLLVRFGCVHCRRLHACWHCFGALHITLLISCFSFRMAGKIGEKMDGMASV